MPLVFALDHDHGLNPGALRVLLGANATALTELAVGLGLPVPAGFTLSVHACTALSSGDGTSVLDEVREQLARLETVTGYRFGDPESPLLVAVRPSPVAASPGLFSTVLNVGLNDRSIEGLARRSEDRFALDAYRRLLADYGRSVLGVSAAAFEERLEAARRSIGVGLDTEFGADALRAVVVEFGEVIGQHGGSLPQDPFEQLTNAVTAVFEAWQRERTRPWHRHGRTGSEDGMAVTVQVMAFGNCDDRSCSGLLVTRDPITGGNGPVGEIVLKAQRGDSLGAVDSLPIGALETVSSNAALRVREIARTVQHAMRDMVAVEFVVERGEVWVIGAYPAQRSGAAALRAAVEMTASEDLGLTRAEAVRLVSEEHLEQVLHPAFAGDGTAIARGIGASPGAAVGQVYFNADDALDAYNRGEDVILVRVETSPEDVHGMEVSQGILTGRGGLASHAAVVARGWGIPAVVGVQGIEIGERSLSAGGIVVREGQVISINGSNGEVMLDAMATVEAAPPAEFETLLAWADDIRTGRFGVRANADTATDATRARSYGAEGIGLCRTEHMFLGEHRLPVVRRAILARDPDEEVAALAALVDVQERDFAELLEAMDGLPVTVRLLDPPLHEFLPAFDEVIAAEARGDVLSEDELALHEAARAWREQNPMLGTRGVRLGVLRPELYRTQVRALASAIVARRAAGGVPIVELMIPLVVSLEEMAYMRAIVEDELAKFGLEGAVAIGTMVETPRAALCAGDIARAADFFSFGTNDLTQMTFGFSRDDVEGRIMSRYLNEGLIAANPFETIDADGVGELVALGAARGRATKPDLKVGVCGEHGGDPASIAVFVAAGIDYVSCSPFRVPVARLAAAQALLEADASSS